MHASTTSSTSTGPMGSRPPSASPGGRTSTCAGEKIEVVVEADPGRTGTVRSALAARGAVVEESYGELTKALVSVDDLAGLARGPGVRSVEPPQRVTPAAIAGQGVAASNASLAQAGGDKGAGVKIGIVDVGFYGFAAMHGSRRAALRRWRPQSYCGGTFEGELEPRDGGCRDRATRWRPGAELHADLHRRTVVDLGLAKDYAIANGITIVNLSAGWSTTRAGATEAAGPGTPDGIVRSRALPGSCGSSRPATRRERHWCGTFRPAARGRERSTTSRSGDEGDQLHARSQPAGLRLPQVGCVADDDDAATSTSESTRPTRFELVAASTERSGVARRPAEPTETCVLRPAGAAWSTFGIAIGRYAADDRRGSTSSSTGRPFEQYRRAAGSLDRACVRIRTVLAVRRRSAGTTAEPSSPYSSSGPTIDGRDEAGHRRLRTATRPRRTARSASSPGCGVTGFTGTSAAAPHVAGVSGDSAAAERPTDRRSAAGAARGIRGGPGRGRQGQCVSAGDASASRPHRTRRRTRRRMSAVAWSSYVGSSIPTAGPARTAGSTRQSDLRDVLEHRIDGVRCGLDAHGGVLLLDGLEPTTTYYARFVTQNPHGMATGNSTTFTTVASAKPYASVSAATGITHQSATLHGIVNPNGVDTTYRFAYGLLFPPSTDTAEVALSGDVVPAGLGRPQRA